MTAEGWDACSNLSQMHSALDGWLEANPARKGWLERKCRLYALACLTPHQSEFQTPATREASAFLQKHADTRIAGIKGVVAARQQLESQRNSPPARWSNSTPFVVSALWFSLISNPLSALRADLEMIQRRRRELIPSADQGNRFVEEPIMAGLRNEYVALLREVFGNPFRPVSVPDAWRTADVRTVALATHQSPDPATGQLDPARLAVLADALEEACCDDAALLTHLRSSGPHVPGCWAVDAILGKG